ncbi:MAG: hypothetical protein JXR80_10220 [Deltaproteobacteria bacterium]|nr:hypothetical protein [Deltaproteobacteria bacterium]
MLNLASLCFPDPEKSCFYCCPPIRDPAADPLDTIAERKLLLRNNRRELQKNLAAPHEISGESCWGLGFLDDREKQAGCLLHPLRHQGRDLRHLTGYQFKCANALCREAQVFAVLSTCEQNFCLNLCRNMDSFHYSSRRNPLMRLLAWEKEIVQTAIHEFLTEEYPDQTSRENGPSPDPDSQSDRFTAEYDFLWQKLDFRLDAYPALYIAERKGLHFLRQHLDDYLDLRNGLINDLKKNQALPKHSDSSNLIPAHKLNIPLSLSRLLKFGADLWEMPAGCEEKLLQQIAERLKMI